MWHFGPDQIWIDKEYVFIKTPRLHEDWPVRNYRKTLFRFQGKNYTPLTVKEIDNQFLYKLGPFDPEMDFPGHTVDYDENYVHTRERNRTWPLRLGMGSLGAVTILFFFGWLVYSQTKGVTSNGRWFASSLVTANEADFKLASFDGNFIWLDFSAPWCGPCRSQASQMKHMEEANPDVAFVTILVSDQNQGRPSHETARAWSRQYGLNPGRVVADVKGEMSRAWNVSSIPLNVLISPDGTILYSQTGSHQVRQMQEILGKYQ